MKQYHHDPTDAQQSSTFPDATAYIARLGVDGQGFPQSRLERLQYLLTAEPNAGCRVSPDPNWDPNECREACDEHFRELKNLQDYIEAFRQGGLAAAEAALAALEESAAVPAPPEKETALSDVVSRFYEGVQKCASTDHRTATERALDAYREHVRQQAAE